MHCLVFTTPDDDVFSPCQQDYVNRSEPCKVCGPSDSSILNSRSHLAFTYNTLDVPESGTRPGHACLVSLTGIFFQQVLSDLLREQVFPPNQKRRADHKHLRDCKLLFSSSQLGRLGQGGGVCLP